MLKNKLNKTYLFSKRVPAKYRSILLTSKAVRNRFIIWNKKLPVRYLKVSGNEVVKFFNSCTRIESGIKTIKIDKKIYGSVALITNYTEISKRGLPVVFNRSGNIRKLSKAHLNENNVIKLYSWAFMLSNKSTRRPIISNLNISNKTRKNRQLEADRRGYIKHIVRLRYRWFFKPKLAKFKLFKKFFKRSLKRFRKINKNKLFVDKFRSHFSRLTGFKEKSLFKLWLPFRRGYSRYWSNTNAVLRFSQSLILTPPSFLVFMQVSPSLAASKYLIKSGAVSINGKSVTNFTVFKPGDIMQLNTSIWKSVRSFFSYQRWNNNLINLQKVPFIYVDWSSMIFFMLRWPHKHELVAPSFLSERWVRYYIRLFPVKTGKFKRARNNLKIYKKIVNKR